MNRAWKIRRTESSGRNGLPSGSEVLVTGAAGFIGSQVVRMLLTRECRVTAVIRPGSKPTRLADVVDKVTLVEANLQDIDTCRDLVSRFEPSALIHLAWSADSGDLTNHLSFLTGGLALLESLAATDCRRVVVAGTSAEYDADLGYVTESSAVRPRTLYGACKASLGLAGEQLARRDGWSFTQARIFDVYGPGEDDQRFVPRVVGALLRGESCDLSMNDNLRDFLHVEDVASALVALAASDIEGAVNVASGRPVTVASVVKTVAGLVGRPDLVRTGDRTFPTGDSPGLHANNRLIRGRVGWSPRYGLDAGLSQTIAWWRDAPHNAHRGPVAWRTGR